MSFPSQVTKNEDNTKEDPTKVAFASSNASLENSGFDLTRNSISMSGLPNAGDLFLAPSKSLMTLNVQILPFVNLICFCNYKSFFLKSVQYASSSGKRCPTSGRLAHKFAQCGFKVYDLITCKSKVEGVASLES